MEEVARNKTMKDEWPLLEADKGDIQLRCRMATTETVFQPITLLEDEVDVATTAPVIPLLSSDNFRIYLLQLVVPADYLRRR